MCCSLVQPASFEFYDPESPIYTSPRGLQPSKISDSKVSQSLISHGCIIDKSIIDHSIIGLRSVISSGCTIKDAMLMGADFYESGTERLAMQSRGRIPVGIGENTLITNTIVDKNARVGNNCALLNKEGVDEKHCEEQGYIIRSGIVTVLSGAEIPDGTII